MRSGLVNQNPSSKYIGVWGKKGNSLVSSIVCLVLSRILIQGADVFLGGKIHFRISRSIAKFKIRIFQSKATTRGNVENKSCAKPFQSRIALRSRFRAICSPNRCLLHPLNVFNDCAFNLLTSLSSCTHWYCLLF